MEISIVLTNDSGSATAVLGQFIESAVADTFADRQLAQQAAAAAQASQIAADLSASAASGSATAAGASATAASGSATSASGSATAASESATTASTQATNAMNSAAAAAASATAAGISATNASTSASSASTSASNAAATLANALTKANNLSDVANAATARTNLGAAPLNTPVFIGIVTVPTGFTVLNASGQANFNINGSAGFSRQFQFQTAGSNRWTLATDQTTEASGNLGSDFGLYNFDNTGTYLSNPLKIYRNSGQMYLSVRPVFNGNTPYDTGNFNPNAIPGVTNGSNAATGNIGEFLSSTAPLTTTSSGTVNNLAQISLTAGDWDVSGVIHFQPGSGTAIQGRLVSISTTSGTTGPIGTSTLSRSTLATNLDEVLPSPVVRVSLASAGTVYLISNVVFTGGSLQVEGFIRARRVR